MRTGPVDRGDTSVAERARRTMVGFAGRRRHERVRRHVAGGSVDTALPVAAGLRRAGLLADMQPWLRSVVDDTSAQRNADELAAVLGRADLPDGAELTIPVGALAESPDRVRVLAQAAGERVRLAVTARDHREIDAVLTAATTTRSLTAVLPAQLRRTEGDARELAHDGIRVRLVKGTASEPTSTAYPTAAAVDRSYARCLDILMAGSGAVAVATADPRLIPIAGERARWYGRDPGSYEFGFLLGVCADEQRRLVARGARVRVALPYGDVPHTLTLRQVAERPGEMTPLLVALRGAAS